MIYIEFDETLYGDDIEFNLTCYTEPEAWGRVIPIEGSVVYKKQLYKLGVGRITGEWFGLNYELFFGRYVFRGTKKFDLFRPLESVSTIRGHIYKNGEIEHECVLKFNLKEDLIPFLKSFRIRE